MVSGTSDLHKCFSHEIHHLWHSRALYDSFLINYGLQGLNSLILKGKFTAEINYYEDLTEKYKWW